MPLLTPELPVSPGGPGGPSVEGRSAPRAAGSVPLCDNPVSHLKFAVAARLQSLSRDLDAAIVIDAATWTAAGDARVDFERHEKTPIRGCHQTEDVYVLPLTVPVW
jgi:hypothetical protein